MIYTKLTNKAMKLAYDAHHGQVDCNGVPYIFHPYHLAEQMTDEITTCVALLHDVVEDTDVTIEELEAEFPKEVTEAVRLLTHDKSTDYFDYVRAIKTNPIAKTVKLADLSHNQDESRIAVPTVVTERKLKHWREKYAKAREILEDASCTIRLADNNDLPVILEIYQTARKFMADNGNGTQWGDSYPPVDLVKSDMVKQQLYVITTDHIVHGVFVFMTEPEPNYKTIESGAWLSDTPYRAIHRVASDGTQRGIVSRCMDYCKAQCSHLRIDTHENNLVMQHVLEKNGFKKCGIVHLENGSPRIAYEYLEMT